MYHIKTSMAKFCGKATQVPWVGSPNPEGPRCIQQDSMFSLFYGTSHVPGSHPQLSVWMVVITPPLTSLPSILYFGGLLSCYKTFYWVKHQHHLYFHSHCCKYWVLTENLTLHSGRILVFNKNWKKKKQLESNLDFFLFSEKECCVWINVGVPVF